MFSLPQGPGGSSASKEGDTDENPIKLVGCTTAEFEGLLELMNPRYAVWLGPYRCTHDGAMGHDGLTDSSPFSDGPGVPELSKEQWMGVLKLGRLWDMPKVGVIKASIDTSA